VLLVIGPVVAIAVVAAQLFLEIWPAVVQAWALFQVLPAWIRHSTVACGTLLCWFPLWFYGYGVGSFMALFSWLVLATLADPAQPGRQLVVGAAQAGWQFAVAYRVLLGVLVLAVAFFAVPTEIGPVPPSMDVFRAAENATASFPRPLPTLDNLNRTLGGDYLVPEYLNQDAFLGHLVRYGNSLPSSSVCIIWGPKDSGKSRGISLLTRTWSQQGRLVVDVNLKGFTRSFAEFETMMADAFREALASVPEAVPFQELVRVARSHRPPKAADALLNRMLGFFSEGVSSWVGLVLSVFPSAKRTSTLQAQALNSYVTAMMPENRPDALFDTLELLGRQHPALAPVFVFHEFGQLLRLKDTNTTELLEGEKTEAQQGEAWLIEFFQKLEPRKATPSMSSVILETSETSWRGFQSLSESRATFQDVLVSNLEQDSATPALKRLTHWTDEHISKVFFCVLYFVLSLLTCLMPARRSGSGRADMGAP
jgi:hypothetical protein